MRTPSRAGALAALLACGACAPESVDMRTETNGCTDYDANNVGDSVLEDETSGSDYVFWRTNVILASDMAFDPTLDQERREITIREYWVGDGVATETCFEPTVILESPPAGEWTIFWYVGDDSVPLDNRVIKVD